MGSATRRSTQMHPQSHQGICGDAIATIEGIDREALDALALVSQQRADARDQGRPLRQVGRPRCYNEDGTVALDRRAIPPP